MRKRLNVRLLLTLTAAAVTTGTAVHLAHGYQMRRFARDLVERAEEAAGEGKNERAAALLGRCLLFVPDDPDNLARYGDALQQLATSRRLRARALGAYQEALARAPTRKDLREKIAPLALDLGQYAEARKQLTALLDAAPDRGDLLALLARCDEADGAPARAARSYEKAVALLPGRVDLAVRLANLYRDRLDQPDRADEVMDRLVGANPEDYRAHLARAQFRAASGATAEAAGDLARAAEQAPDAVEVLLADAVLAGQTGRVDLARAALRKGLDRHPEVAALYLRLAELESRTGNGDEAVGQLRRGLRQLPDQPDLLKALGEALVGAGRLEEAGEVVGRLRGPGQSPWAADYLQARALLAKGQVREAARVLEQVCLSAPRDDAPLAGRAHLALGEAYARIGYADRRAQLYRRALSWDPSSSRARLSLGDALSDAGRVEEAIEEYRRAARAPDAPREGRARLARALIRQNVYLPPDRRDWKEVDRLLDEAGRDAAQAVTAALLQAEALTARGRPGEARGLLERAARDHPGDADLGLALADLDAGRGEFDAAVRRLDDTWGKAGRRLEERAARLEAWAERGSRAAARSLEELARDLDRLSEEDRVALVRHLATAYRHAGRQAEWLRLCQQLAEEPFTDLAAAQQLLELVVLVGDPGLMTVVVNHLRRLEGEGGTAWRFGAAAVCVARARGGDRAALAPARGWLDIVSRVRPDWPRPALLYAQIEEMEGRPEEALAQALRAFALGDRQPGPTLRLVRQLAGRGRYADADRVVRQYQQQAALGRDLARQAAEIAFQAGNFERAGELAAGLVPEGNADFRDQLWLGRLLGRMARRPEAERALFRATELAPRVPDTWVALVDFLAHNGQTARAADIVAALGDKLSPDQVKLARARCWLALYRTDKAEEEYRAALDECPRDGRVLLAAAGFYLRVGEADRAEALLRKLLGPGVLVPEEDLPAIRRQLALMLSERGGEERVREALALLDQNPAAEAVADRRTRLLVQAARPDGRKEALAALDELKDGPPLTPEQRYRLARLFDAEGDWQRTRALLFELLDGDGYNPAYLTFFIDGLLRHDEASEAGPWLTRLEKAAPDAPRTKELRAKLGGRAG
jgi:tetratricopeptide (TPR) repeat protein